MQLLSEGGTVRRSLVILQPAGPQFLKGVAAASASHLGEPGSGRAGVRASESDFELRPFSQRISFTDGASCRETE